MNQALSIWSELWQAYYGKNGYGGDTAEIYAYRVMPYEPVVAGANMKDFRETETFKRSSRAAYAKATNSLVNLLIKFESADCHLEVNGKSIREWAEKEYFDHRCHVKVNHKKVW
jgi:hypothetical protein